jgi:hypothetical protein
VAAGLQQMLGLCCLRDASNDFAKEGTLIMPNNVCTYLGQQKRLDADSFQS